MEKEKITQLEIRIEDIITDCKRGDIPVIEGVSNIIDIINSELTALRKELERLRGALITCHKSLCTYGQHPIIDIEVNNALKTPPQQSEGEEELGARAIYAEQVCPHIDYEKICETHEKCVKCGALRQIIPTP